MNQDNYITLIYKKLKKEITSEEQADLNKWAGTTKENALLQQQLEDNWKASKTALPPISIDAKKDFQGFKKRMQQHKGTKEDTKEAIVRPLNSRRRLLAIAAVIAIPILAALWVFMPPSTAPMLVAQTSTGQTKVIPLDDGTTVTLNENTTFTYPATFAANDRTIQLNGEAFFEVAKDPSRPFEVHTEKASVKVLGTVFNVRSIADETTIKVNVEEGKVQLSSTIAGQGVILTAGEMGVYDLTDNKIIEHKVNHKNASAWKTKNLKYSNTPLKTVIADLAQHFNVKVSIAKESMDACPLTARFGETTAKEVLDYIAGLYQMKLTEIDDVTFELVGGVCE